MYELPGGHINFGEDIVIGLKREIEEELAMHVSIGDPFHVFTYTNHVKESHSIQVTYFATFDDSLENIIFQEDEIAAVGWFSEKEITTHILTEEKGMNDKEIQAMFKGFALLKNNRISLS